MPSKAFWLVEKHLIMLENSGAITADDLISVDKEICAMMDTSDKPAVHIIVDARNFVSIPKIREMTNIKLISHDKLGWVVPTKANPFVKMLIAIMTVTTRNRVRHCNTIEDGLVFLMSVDDTLPTLDEINLQAKNDEQLKEGEVEKGA